MLQCNNDTIFKTMQKKIFKAILITMKNNNKMSKTMKNNKNNARNYIKQYYQQ